MNGAGSLSPLIHLVDDDAAVRDALELLIGTVGLRVEQWASPERFLADFDRQSIGAIVLDIRMPGLSGLSVLDSLQAAGVDHPVIMLTGHGTVDERLAEGHDIPDEERALMDRALAENAVIVAQMEPLFGDEDEDEDRG